MKKIIKISMLAAAILAITACSSTEETMTETKMETKAVNSGKTINFVYEDIIGDDNGPGNYTYPSSNVMVDSAFDLEKFSITEEDGEYVFTFQIGTEFKNDFGTDDDWDIQLFDVYMNLGEGKYKHTIAGRRVKLAEGWDKSLVVTPVGPMTAKYETKKSARYSVDDETPLENFIADISVPDSKEVDGNTVIIRVTKDRIGDLSNLQSVQVFLSGFEGFADDENSAIRDVTEYEEKWKFGGGTPYSGNPNVIDILGDNSKLGEYVSEKTEKIYPTVNMITVE